MYLGTYLGGLVLGPLLGVKTFCTNILMWQIILIFEQFWKRTSQMYPWVPPFSFLNTPLLVPFLDHSVYAKPTRHWRLSSQWFVGLHQWESHIDVEHDVSMTSYVTSRRIRRSSVHFGGKTFLPENYVWTINKMPEFYAIFARKIIKLPEFLWCLTEKLTKFPNFT